MASNLKFPPDQVPCLFLQRLPGELRNIIYEYALMPHHRENEAVDILNAAPPTKSLVLTCRVVRKEAAGFHRAAYQRYWRTTRFFAQSGSFDTGRFRELLDRLDKTGVNNITDLTLELKPPPPPPSGRLVGQEPHFFALRDRRGGWDAACETCRTYVHIHYNVWSNWSDADRVTAKFPVIGAIMLCGNQQQVCLSATARPVRIQTSLTREKLLRFGDGERDGDVPVYDQIRWLEEFWDELWRRKLDEA